MERIELAQKYVTEGREPKAVLQYFEEICRIPHGSGNTDEICEYLMNFAKTHGLECRKDEANNVVIRKPATPGYEQAKAVILQGHHDMVCEKTPESTHDFEKDPLDLYIDGEFLKARGTTLGGDDGIAVAIAMAALTEPDVIHPKLEVLLTSDEEIGLLGAQALDCSDLEGRMLINLDSEEEGTFLVGCAGGMHADVVLPVVREEKAGAAVVLTLSGLTGGHSGAEIDKNRLSASKAMGRLLLNLKNQVGYSLKAFEGGTRNNVIPSLSTATLVAEEADVEKVKAIAEEFRKELEKEYMGIEPNLSLTAEGTKTGSFSVLDADSLDKVLLLINMIPYGPAKMSGMIPGLVETSSNPGIVKLNENDFMIQTSIRSSVTGARDALADQICFLAKSVGASYEAAGVYPAWEYQENSRLRDLMVEKWEEETGKKPNVQVIHAGLECGLFCGKMEGLDCVSLGPDLRDIHSPKERLNIASVEKCWKYMKRVLEALAKQEG